eukprot:CAMPEP_0194159522 /NCGR_PEP_ID=MMETSP0152-20130528/77876_1 /TAXON_ID=1049557 /ORGANISM="Thalassiothrix antarctica, Strain L6-D1" /LENGTH=440 /DNA_ID=CAMNT_0038869097 /DNA_START=88 /DNA_END=1410 /DNA_ORIENTATION=+
MDTEKNKELEERGNDLPGPPQPRGTSEESKNKSKAKIELAYSLDVEEPSLLSSQGKPNKLTKIGDKVQKKKFPLTYSWGIVGNIRRISSPQRWSNNKEERPSLEEPNQLTKIGNELHERKFPLTYSRGTAEDRRQIPSPSTRRNNEREESIRLEQQQQQIGAFLVRPGNDVQRASSVISATDTNTVVVGGQGEVQGSIFEDVLLVPTATVVKEQNIHNEEDIEARIDARVAARMGKITNATVLPASTSCNRNKLLCIFILLTLLLVGTGIAILFTGHNKDQLPSPSLSPSTKLTILIDTTSETPTTSTLDTLPPTLRPLTSPPTIKSFNVPCYVCGNENKEVGNLNASVKILSSEFSCKEIQVGGKCGKIPPAHCNFFAKEVNRTCGCTVKLIDDDDLDLDDDSYYNECTGDFEPILNFTLDLTCAGCDDNTGFSSGDAW